MAVNLGLFASEETELFSIVRVQRVALAAVQRSLTKHDIWAGLERLVFIGGTGNDPDYDPIFEIGIATGPWEVRPASDKIITVTVALRSVPGDRRLFERAEVSFKLPLDEYADTVCSLVWLIESSGLVLISSETTREFRWDDRDQNDDDV